MHNDDALFFKLEAAEETQAHICAAEIAIFNVYRFKNRSVYYYYYYAA